MKGNKYSILFLIICSKGEFLYKGVVVSFSFFSKDVSFASPNVNVSQFPYYVDEFNVK